MVERIVVPFEGDGAGVGALAWGQQQVWRAMVEVESSMSMGGVVPITDGRTLPDFVEELRFLMSRYGALRSRLIFDEPWHATSVDACHLVRQETFARGEAVLEVHDAGPDEDPAAVAGAVFAAWKARNFDYTGEWPIREAVIRHRGAITHVIVLVCHIAADGSGLGTMIREMGERDPVRRRRGGRTRRCNPSNSSPHSATGSGRRTPRCGTGRRSCARSGRAASPPPRTSAAGARLGGGGWCGVPPR